MSDDHRTVVRLLFYDGWSVAETAVLLGIPAGTVKSRSYYALKALRGVLNELGVTR
ncbi:sigma factor-like helix-turn-helix DNA-binding protein [Amnibacterium endophyticum]|uniref:Sigma factor-like helix-turn-helix DNA-binding protein n=1 Tax=Amnibacterium endophyticum TaxID=2109337 RepID=A0ABW4LI55_9MICO